MAQPQPTLDLDAQLAIFLRNMNELVMARNQPQPSASNVPSNAGANIATTTNATAQAPQAPPVHLHPAIQPLGHINLAVPPPVTHSDVASSDALGRIPGNQYTNPTPPPYLSHAANVNQARVASFTQASNTASATKPKRKKSKTSNGTNGGGSGGGSTSTRPRGPAYTIPALHTMPMAAAQPSSYRFRILFHTLRDPVLGGTLSRPIAYRLRLRQWIERQEAYGLTYVFTVAPHTTIEHLVNLYVTALETSSRHYHIEKTPDLDMSAPFAERNPFRIYAPVIKGRKPGAKNHLSAGEEMQVFNLPPEYLTVDQLWNDPRLQAHMQDDVMLLNLQNRFEPFGYTSNSRLHSFSIHRRLYHKTRWDLHDGELLDEAKRSLNPQVEHDDPMLATDEDEGDPTPAPRPRRPVPRRRHRNVFSESESESEHQSQPAATRTPTPAPLPPTRTPSPVASGSDIQNAIVVDEEPQRSWTPPTPDFLRNILQETPVGGSDDAPHFPLSLSGVDYTGPLAMATWSNVPAWMCALPHAIIGHTFSFLPPLRLEVNSYANDQAGAALDRLGELVLRQVEDALVSGDMSPFILGKVTYTICHTSEHTAQGPATTTSRISGITTGPGIEVETLTRLVKKLMEDEAVIVRNRDELATLSIQGDPSLNDWVAPARLRRFRCLGAVTALHLIRHGILADGLSPCVVQVIANQGEIRALDQQFLKDFAPEVLQDILSWRELGVEGPINPLHRINTYICNFGGGVVPAALRDRDSRRHMQFEREILVNGTVGRWFVGSQEAKAWKDGFDLPVPNGRALSQLLHCFQGGSQALIRATALTHIVTNEAINTVISTIIPVFHASYNTQLQTLTNDPTITIMSLIERYLRGSGAPSPKAEAAILSQYPNIKQEDINKTGFRASAFYQAISGSDRIIAGRLLKIHIANIDDVSYESGRARREMCHRQGIIAWKTCPTTVYIPDTHLLDLARKGKEKLDKRFGSWLFFQSIHAIGHHSQL